MWKPANTQDILTVFPSFPLGPGGPDNPCGPYWREKGFKTNEKRCRKSDQKTEYRMISS